MDSWITRRPAPLPVLPDQLKLFDTATSKTVHPGNTTEASMYVCGITPYDATHLGHANTYVAFDLLYRYWLASGVQVSYVQNVTDVDDPLLERAEKLRIDWRELAHQQTDLFRSDMTALNVVAPDHYIGATETVHWVVDSVEKMLDNGTAYRVAGENGEPDGDVYFSIDSAEAATNWQLGMIGAHSAAEMAEIFPERGGDPQRAGKRNPLDPLLWRVAREGEPTWDGGTLGTGRPGWHIECSAIARHLLPSPFTVQGGGSDLRFPHHEFSAAHATALDGKPLARTYIHSGMVGLDGVKMSKSLGNLVLVSKLMAEGADPMAIRLVLLDNHYRADWSFTPAMLENATARLNQWRAAVQLAPYEDGTTLQAQIHAALSNDLDAASALSDIDEWASAITNQPDKDDGEQQSNESVPTVRTVIDALLGVTL